METLSTPDGIATTSRWSIAARNAGAIAVIAAVGGVAGFAFARLLWA